MGGLPAPGTMLGPPPLSPPSAGGATAPASPAGAPPAPSGLGAPPAPVGGAAPGEPPALPPGGIVGVPPLPPVPWAGGGGDPLLSDPLQPTYVARPRSLDSSPSD